MKEKLYTLEIMDAIKAEEECPFCYLERKLEQETISFVLGSSYMESDMREQTDHQGFCRNHTRMMFQYGNQLGNAWILKSRFQHLNQGLKKKLGEGSKPKSSLLGKLKKTEQPVSAAAGFIQAEEKGCYICSRMETVYQRMMATFVFLVETDEEFLTMIKSSKGFCLHHFAGLIDLCEEKLREDRKKVVLPVLNVVMADNMDRIQSDIDWFVEKHDYCNAEADWKNSKDAVARTMQKITGGYPGDGIYKIK